MSTPIAEQLHALATKSDPETAAILIEAQGVITAMLAALHAAGGAMIAMSDQIEQMRGMFDDEDGTIEAALDDAEEAWKVINPAIALATGKEG